jgi:lipopolysaccharide transport system ATP-binding protein
MSDTIIRVENLGKKYLIKHQQQGSYTALRDVITEKTKSFCNKIASPWKHKKETKNSSTEEFWAVKDISFEIKQGEVLGIIGRNGAGKSTLLKILSRITEPTTGQIRINGRVASLLEVGTGFHPELTGRENIFLNGAILGMMRHEINKKFDEIVAFAEVEKFLDTPVKRYSSGMYVRLAFAVAAHLEPEILLVDEVLAVGDAAFQKKCLGKMGDISQEGRTLLFVSHKMDAIRRLCQSAILLHDGELIKKGPTETVVNHYLSGTNLYAELKDRGPAPDKAMHLRSVKLMGEKLHIKDHFARNESGYVEVLYDINTSLENVHIVCHFVDNEDRVIISTGDCDVSRRLHQKRKAGTYRAKFKMPTDILNEGEYSLIFALGVPYGQNYDRLTDVLRFSLSDSRECKGPEYIQRRPGFVLQDLPWETERI